MTFPVHHLSRPAAVLAGAAALVLSVSACGVLGGADDAKRDSASGEITESAEASVFSLEVKDCLVMPSAGETMVESLNALPCDQPHDGQIYAEQTLTELPEQTELDAMAQEFCLTEFEPFVGTAYESSVLEVTFLYPTEQSWQQGDDALQCVAQHPSEMVTQSFEGSAL